MSGESPPRSGLPVSPGVTTIPTTAQQAIGLQGDELYGVITCNMALEIGPIFGWGFHRSHKGCTVRGRCVGYQNALGYPLLGWLGHGQNSEKLLMDILPVASVSVLAGAISFQLFPSPVFKFAGSNESIENCLE